MAEMDLILLVFVAVMLFAALMPEFIRGIRLYGRRSSFICQSCGNCCRFRVTPLTNEDVGRLESAGLRDFSEPYKGELRMRRIKGRCMFLKDDACQVYEHRPQVCRNFPFFKEWGVGFAQKATFCPALEELENG